MRVCSNTKNNLHLQFQLSINNKCYVKVQADPSDLALQLKQNKTKPVLTCCLLFLSCWKKNRHCMKFIFRPSPSKTVTVNKLLNLLTCKFSVVGSNLRREEEKTYKKFVKYCREVFGK